MKVNLTLILFIIIAILLTIGFIGYNNMQNKIEEAQQEYRQSIIRNDSLRLENGRYKKLVGDTATVRQLRERIAELELEVKDPVIIEQIVMRPSDTIKIVDSIYVNEGEVYITDYYPNKSDYFVRYSNNFNLETLQGQGKWQWRDIEINLAISENEDGTFETTMQGPEFITVGRLDVTSLPLSPQKPDNFGILLGGGIGQDFRDDSNYIKLGAGVRFKKTYLMLEANSNKQADVGIKYEF